ncbi:hypothetical protein D3C74_60220 [compost metagenome]
MFKIKAIAWEVQLASRLQGNSFCNIRRRTGPFLQRLASHAGATLIPNTLSHHPQIWIGIPQTGKQIRLEDVPFTLKRNLAPYLDQVMNRGASVRAEDYTRYTFEWDRILQLGDEVHRGHEVYVITRRAGQMVGGLMTWSYECAIPEGQRVPKRYNQTIIGASIEGKIIEVSRNQVRLHLDLDKQPPQAAQWFPYSAEGNQVWYLMPEKGAQVKLYFPGKDEDDAMVIQSVRTSPSTIVAPVASANTAAPRAIVDSRYARTSSLTARRDISVVIPVMTVVWQLCLHRSRSHRGSTRSDGYPAPEAYQGLE